MSYNYYKYSFSLGYFIFYFKDSVKLEVCIIVAVSSCIENITGTIPFIKKGCFQCTKLPLLVGGLSLFMEMLIP